MKREILAARVSALAREHHDAFAEDLLAFIVPGTDLDYYEYVHMVSRVFDDAEPSRRHEMRRWSTESWNDAVTRKHAELMQTDPVFDDAVVSWEVEKPPAPGAPSRPVATSAPSWLAPSEQLAWQSARDRAGAYARGLGDSLGESLEGHIFEVWSGEDIVLEADADLRAERVAQIREATADAVAHHDDPTRLALELMRKTDDWGHQWEMIAQTEIQGAYNESRVMSAISEYGLAAQIAKVPETSACSRCKDIYLGEDGRPLVFSVEELLAAGSNVGRPRSEWRATVWPMHPNCRCDSVVVPPGMDVGQYGELRREDADS